MNTMILNGVIVNYPDVGHETARPDFRQHLIDNQEKVKPIAAQLAKALGPGWMAELDNGNCSRDFYLVGEDMRVHACLCLSDQSQRRYSFSVTIPDFDGYSHCTGHIKLDTRRKPETIAANLRRLLFPQVREAQEKAKIKIATDTANFDRRLGVAKLFAEMIGTPDAWAKVETMQQPGNRSLHVTFYYYPTEGRRVEIGIDTTGRVDIRTFGLDFEIGLSMLEQLKGE